MQKNEKCDQKTHAKEILQNDTQKMRYDQHAVEKTKNANKNTMEKVMQQKNMTPPMKQPVQGKLISH